MLRVHSFTSMNRLIVLLTTALLSGGLAASIYVAEDPAPTAPSRPAAGAVHALVTMPPSAVLHRIPSDFATINGYRPQIRSGHAVDPTGGCSSPVPLPREFDPICRQHDLGYDLLRTADATGGTLPATARHAVDRQFATDTHRVCRERTNPLSRTECGVWADIATGAVEFNSWRQHWSTPSAETPVSLTAIVAASVAAICAVLAVVLGIRELTRRVRRFAIPRLPERAHA